MTSLYRFGCFCTGTSSHPAAIPIQDPVIQIQRKIIKYERKTKSPVEPPKEKRFRLGGSKITENEEKKLP